MKIVHIAPPWIAVPPRDYGGTETVVHCLIEEQIAQGHDVTLIAAGDSQTSAHLIPLIQRGLREDAVPWNDHQRELAYLQQAISFIQGHDFDIVHTHVSSGGDMFLFPLLAQLRVPHITTLHSNLPFQPAEIPDEVSKERFLRWAPQVPMVAISESARQQQGLPLNFVGVVHHGLPLKDIPAPLMQPSDAFLWLGRFVPEKGPHLAIKAAQQAHKPLILAGKITQDTPRIQKYYREEIEAQVDGQQIQNHGPADFQEKQELMRQARGFLNPIEWEEPFGMVMIEAMAAGCPVISFARGAAPEIIRNGETGFLVETLDEMVQAMGRIDEINRETVRAHIQESFSCEAMERKYYAIYHKVISIFQPEELPFFE
ncbi:glycosyltransferase family 4 protein [Dictyobacter arantiisoli]|uniref:Glycosyl transferase n=1 Tax=Dictyobacter arantiisoli TaxID=2014874 RepID=A0A5A5TJD7_9CHLR|nr:glycosyltransferase family 4 protein [Dictyobacter arantiisoli]GCF11547.1 glycosyl transferase [Dictyobacter arantiisoli]